jgi:GIY-YIG catalytic domain
MKRTARKDSNFVIYAATHNGSSYIGLTRKGSTTVSRAVKERWRKHISRAKHEAQDWRLYNYIRAGNWTDWEHEVITVIRGRAEAYAFERALVKEIEPELNDQYL